MSVAATVKTTAPAARATSDRRQSYVSQVLVEIAKHHMGAIAVDVGSGEMKLYALFLQPDLLTDQLVPLIIVCSCLEYLLL